MIFTFYSYKGGVGRSMALANVAKCLYLRGLRVVMIDWDLEAPGLESYFFGAGEKLDTVRSQLGLIDLLVSYKEQLPHWEAPKERDQFLTFLNDVLPPISHCLYPIDPPQPLADGRAPAMWILTAGWRSGERFPAYARAVQDFDWADFYERYRGEEYFEWLRQQLSDELTDVVLIDSRTGVSEMGGVCTRHLADIVVSFCVPNIQNLSSIDMMAVSFKREEVIEARGHRELDVIVVPSRVETSEIDERERFEAEFRRVLTGHTPDDFRRCGTDFWRMAIPYIPKYAYAEQLAIGAPGAAEELTSAYERLAAHLAILSPEGGEMRKRLAADIDREFGKSLPRVCLAYERADREFAASLRARLEAHDRAVTLWPDPVRPDPTEDKDWWNSTFEALDHVEIAVLIVTPASIESPGLRRAWRYARQQGVCVFAVTAGASDGLDLASLPRGMRKARFFHLEPDWQDFVRALKSPCYATRVPCMAPELPLDFVNRARPLKLARDLLLGVDARRPAGINFALHGAGGMGKTTLAAAVCHDGEVMDAFDDGILWVTLGDQPDLLGGLTKLYAALTADRPTFRDLEDAAVQLAAKLKGKECLLVLDDVWKVAHLEPFQRGAPGCTLLITTRCMDVTAGAKRVPIADMTADESVRMLATRLETPPNDLEPFWSLARRLSGWPSVLALAGDSVRQRLARGDTLEGTIAYLHRFVDKKGVLAFDPLDPSGSRKSISKVIDQSLGPLSAEDRRYFLELAIFPEGIEIPLAVVRDLWGIDDFEVEERAPRLCDSALLELSLQNRSLRLHKVVRAYLATQLTDAPAVHARLLDVWGDPRRLPPDHHYAWRWIAYHLKGAKRVTRLRDLLLDYDWIRRKLQATDPDALLADFDGMPEDPVLLAVRSAIRLSAHVLTGDHSQLRSQLVGRLLPHDPSASAGADMDVDVDMDATAATTAILRLLDQACQAGPARWLRPVTPSLTPPGGTLLRMFAHHRSGIRAVAVTSDGRRSVSASGDGTLILWDLERGQPLRVLDGRGATVNAVAMSPGGRRTLSGEGDGTTRIWDMEKGRLIAVLDGPGATVSAVAVLPGGRAVVAEGDGTIRVWDLSTRQPVQVLAGHHGDVRAIAVSFDGGRALSGGDDGSLILWDLKTGAALRRLVDHGERILTVAITPDGNRGLAGSINGTLRAWDFVSGREPQAYPAHRGAVCALAVTPDGHSALSAGEDGIVLVRDLRTVQPPSVLAAIGSVFRALAITSDGSRLVSGSDDGLLRLWRVQGGRPPLTTAGLGGGINALAITPDGRAAVSASVDGTLRHWDLANGRRIRAYEGHRGVVRALAITPDSRHAVTAWGDGKYRVWDLGTGQSRVLEGHRSEIRALAISHDRGRAVSGENNGKIRVVDLETCTSLEVIGRHLGEVHAVAITPDGRRAVLGDGHGTIHVWDLENSRERLVIPSDGGSVRVLAVSRDGRRAVSASLDWKIRIWDTDKGRFIADFEGQGGSIRILAVSADGRRAALASFDRTIQIRDIDTGGDLARFHGDNAFTACVFALDGLTIVAGDSAGQVHFLRLEGL